MTNLVIFNYYYRYRQSRKLVKDLIAIDNNITEAKNRLDSFVIENDNYINNNGSIPNTGDTFTSVDNLSLHHAQDHLNAFQDSNQIKQKQATTDALDPESVVPDPTI